ncbi:MAG: YfiR family protein [Gammaproteobacteria bacterium]|nr:YfiR family protein [Gammaproteobacteria bacterium]
MTCVVLTASVVHAADAQESTVAKIKSAYLLNFLRFTDWPSWSFDDQTSALRVCVIGTDSLGGILDQTMDDELVHGRPIDVLRVTVDDPLQHCHLLYIAASEESRLNDIVSKLNGSSTLTVGETAGFASDGAMLALNREDDRIIFYANRDAIRAGQVRLSSKILQLAKMVDRRGR